MKVIYVAGVGDSDPQFQRRAVETWKWWGVEPVFFQVKWGEDVSWQTKFERLLARIDELTANGEKIALVGASAGGAAVIAAYAARKANIAGVVTICGKLKNPNDIGPRYINTNPPLVDAVTTSDKALAELSPKHRRHILCRYALIDGRVTTRSDSMIDGARNRFSPSFGHAFTIALQLVFGAPSFLRFLKRQNT